MIIVAEGGEELRRAGETGELHRRDRAAARRLLKGVIRVDDLAGARDVVPPDELDPLDVSDYGQLHVRRQILRASVLAEGNLDGRGRVLVRPSGTEPVVRVMVEAPTHDQAETTVAHLCTALAAALGTPTP